MEDNITNFKCSSCGAVLRAEEKVCSYCGAQNKNFEEKKEVKSNTNEKEILDDDFEDLADVFLGGTILKKVFRNMRGPSIFFNKRKK